MIAEQLMNEFITKYADKKIALFADMDGTIANLDIDVNNNIFLNKPGFFFRKRPLTSVIKKLAKIAEYPNVDMHILSACSYKNQATDKSTWLDQHANFFKKEFQIFLVKEVVNYTGATKAQMKVDRITDRIKLSQYDYVIFIEDEYKILKTAQAALGDKILCIHISNFID